MAKTMTASPMTDGQIDDLVNKFRDALRKCRGRIPRDIAQQGLGTDNLGMICVAPYLKLCEKLGGSVTVDYSRTLSDMIKAGHYDAADSDINDQNFPIIDKGQIELVLCLVHFDRGVTSKEAIAELKKVGMRPATPPELLAFGEKYPEEQRLFPIVALGSVWRGPSDGRGVLFLNGRELTLSGFGHCYWDAPCRFLAVHA